MEPVKVDSPALRVDAHVHLVGDGTAGDGCLIFLSGIRMRIQGHVLLKQCGLSLGVLKTGLDQPYREMLRKWISEGTLDAVVLLAMDWPHHEDGTPLRNKAAFYTPNGAVLGLSQPIGRESGFIPAVSIHPARPDAISELEESHSRGARIVKLLPNVHNVDCSRPAYDGFWEKMAELRMVLLSHTGGELALPVINAKLAEPMALRRPLEHGVTVIAAHCGTRDLPWQRCGIQDWLTLCNEFPHLYGDTSALATPNRAYALRRLLQSQHRNRLIHGSDYPIPCGPFGPWLHRLLPTADARLIRRIANPLERDAAIKHKIGLEDDTFTRINGLIGR